MNKAKNIFIAVAVTILCTFLPVFSNPEIITEKQGNITNYRISSDPIKFAEDFDELSSEEKLKLFQNPNTLLPIYYIAIADYYYASDMKDYGLTFYLLGNLRGMQDSAMCEDYTAREQILMYPMYAPKTVEYMANLDNKKLLEIAKFVIKWDEQHTTRPNPKWACYHGIQAFLGEVKIKPMREYPKMQKKIRKLFWKTIKNYDKIKKQKSLNK